MRNSTETKKKYTESEDESLFFVSLQAFFFNCKEFFRVLIRYWSCFAYFKKELCFFYNYLFFNPYTANRALGLEPYGETPLTTIEMIAKKVALTKDDVFLELGSGRGRTLFWLSHFYGCQVVGIDYNPYFIKRCLKISQACGIHNATFICADTRVCHFDEATVLYLYGTLLSDEDVDILIKKFSKLRKGVKIITISFPLSDYEKTKFQLLSSFDVEFPWGKTTCYVQEVR